VQNAAARIVCQAPRHHHHSADLLRISTGYLYVAESTTRSPSQLQSRQTTTNIVSYLSTLVIQTVAVLRSSTSDLLSTQSSSTNIAARRFSCCAPAVGTVFPHSYTLLTVSLVLGLSSRLIRSQDVCSRSAVHASDTLTRSCTHYKFVTYLHT